MWASRETDKLLCRWLGNTGPVKLCTDRAFWSQLCIRAHCSRGAQSAPEYLCENTPYCFQVLPRVLATRIQLKLMGATELTALGNVCWTFPIRPNYKEITGKKRVSAVCLTPLTELNCAGGSLCSVTIHSCCFLTCARGVSCTHPASSYQTVSQA